MGCNELVLRWCVTLGNWSADTSDKFIALNQTRAVPPRSSPLRSGQLSEVLNLVPWGGISLQFRHLRLFGMPGLAGLGEPLLWWRCL